MSFFIGRYMRIWMCSILILLLGVSSQLAKAQEKAHGGNGSDDLMALSLEELMNIEITSVSKKEQSIFEATAAVYVVSQEDIKRSGVKTIPDALRMVPGVQVASIDANKWAITIRGFNSRFANKLLVMIDGRSVYTPTFAGVYWDIQDLLLEDIERIEVIRGPGATLWGSNAVNGIINIITKSARDTQGGLIYAGGGNKADGFGGIRYGSKINDDLYYRIYTKYFNRDNFVELNGNPASDDWQVVRGGFRMDWDVSPRAHLTIQGDIYDGDIGETFMALVSYREPFFEIVRDQGQVSGGNILARWRYELGRRSTTTLQFYFDRTSRTSLNNFTELRHTYDIEYKHQFKATNQHEIIFGLGYRLSSDETKETFSLSLTPARRKLDLLNSFIQNENKFLNDKLRLILGSKFEWNEYTGLELQPSFRLTWLHSENRTVWGAISRAVRIPSRGEHDSRADITAFEDERGLTNVVTFIGNDNLEAESLLAYEMGYRARATESIFFDLALFYNDYDNLVTTRMGIPFMERTPESNHLVIPQVITNGQTAETYGIELGSNISISDNWKISTAFSWLNVDFEEDAANVENTGNQEPEYQFNLRSFVNLPLNLKLDTALYLTDELEAQNVDRYLRADLRLGWKPTDHFDLGLSIQNLLDHRHLEFIREEVGIVPSQIERTVSGTVTWRF